MRRTLRLPRAHVPLFLLFLLVASVVIGHPGIRVTAGEGQSAIIGTALLERVNAEVLAAIEAGQLPGAVVQIWHRGRTIHHEAYGRRAVSPRSEPMTGDTIFDLASLTKVVATTPAIMLLAEEGRVDLRAPVASYLPGFERHGKGAVTVTQLLTHTSGLRPDFDLEHVFDGYTAGIDQAIDERLIDTPGARFIYSDINFILLGELVARVSGQRLDTFAARRVFEPLGMTSTMFRPAEAVRSRIAPTESCTPLAWPCGGAGAEMLRGIVHDPTARRMGGVAGHAGLFASSADLIRFGASLVSGGAADDVRLLGPLAIERMTSPATPAWMADRRGLGWDIDSRFSANRGALFGEGSFGHTGFTGTSIWIDPATQTVVVFLSSRLHPNGGGEVTALRGRVATLAAAAVTGREPDTAGGARRVRPGAVLTGIDVLRDQAFARLDGASVGLLTNQTGRARDGTSTIDLLVAAPSVDLRVLFSPEHGIRGDLEGEVADTVDRRTGLPIYSLYAANRRPTAAMLDGLDAVVVDLQDAGARFYTYATTLAYLMEAAAAADLRVVVLDRPNPVNGQVIEGPNLDVAFRGFTGYTTMPIRHGLTIGELAGLFNDVEAIGARLEVVPLHGWGRMHWFDETGVPWVDPSPNLRSVTQAILYPGIGAIEGSNLSVGRGTDTPFERIGAPWIDGSGLAAALNARRLPGVRVYPITFTPDASRYADERCHGIQLIVTDREALRPVRLGLEIAAAIHRRHPEEFDLDGVTRLLGSADAVRRIRAGDDPGRIAADWADAERRWRATRAPFLLY